MSGPTKAVRVTKAQLEIRVQEEAAKVAVEYEKGLQARVQRDKAITEAQDERRRADHYKGLRDQLLGYVEGRRAQEPIEVDNVNTYYQPPPTTKILPLDVFLDRMRSEP